MIEIAGTQFPLTFEPQMAGRELVLLGVIPIGAIERQATGRYAWSIDLPMIRQRMRDASTVDSARGRVIDQITDQLCLGIGHRGNFPRRMPLTIARRRPPTKRVSKAAVRRAEILLGDV
jgi:hypothetical protein